MVGAISLEDFGKLLGVFWLVAGPLVGAGLGYLAKTRGDRELERAKVVMAEEGRKMAFQRDTLLELQGANDTLMTICTFFVHYTDAKTTATIDDVLTARFTVLRLANRLTDTSLRMLVLDAAKSSLDLLKTMPNEERSTLLDSFTDKMRESATEVGRALRTNYL